MDIGIGLWICKKICNHFEGDIKVISDFGTGSMFTFTIKLYKDMSSLFQSI
jgi:signal transduction histidine kinase